MLPLNRRHIPYDNLRFKCSSVREFKAVDRLPVHELSAVNGQMMPEELAASNRRANALTHELRKRDPERVRALERAKYARRMARDPIGYRAKRRAIEARYRQNKLAKRTGVEVELIF